MKFLATKTKCEDVKPGEAFSTAGPDYWNTAIIGTFGAIGERVYLRTLAPVPLKDVGTEVYVITVVED